MTKSKNSIVKLESSHMSPVKKLKHCKKQKRNGLLRKAPQAPRRFKSSYILFFMAKQDEIKRSLPPGSSVSLFHKSMSNYKNRLSRHEVFEYKSTLSTCIVYFEITFANFSESIIHINIIL